MPKIYIEATREYEQKIGRWGGKEIIPCDPNNPQPFSTTCQLWNYTSPKQWITYNVVARVKKGKMEVHIQYNDNQNRHLPREIYEDIEWGTHILTLQKDNNNCGLSTWIDSAGNKWEGPGWIRREIKGDRRRVTTTILQRKQAEFREMLLARDGSCAITGETCHDVLEAAHIVAAGDGGQEVLENGILLRADLHLLYDADPPKFQICPETGQIVMAEGFNYGGFDLNERQIEEAIYQRVGEALHLRQQMVN